MGIRPASELGDLVAVLVYADHVVAEVSEHGSGHEAYIARSNDTDVHGAGIMIAGRLPG